MAKKVGKVQLDLVCVPCNAPDMSEYGLYTKRDQAKRMGQAKDMAFDRKVEVARFQEGQKALQDFARMQNPIWVAFELSPFGGAASSIKNYSEGNYGWGTLDLALTAFEVKAFFNTRSLKGLKGLDAKSGNSSGFLSSFRTLPIELNESSLRQVTNIIERIYKSRNRPSFRKGVVEKVWKAEAAKDVNGNVYDPNTFELLKWDKTKPRKWDMGHKPGHEWHALRQKYIDGEVTWKEVLDEYNNPDNYLPESRSANRSGKYEGQSRPKRE
ncbi:HNH/ENDO VII family nuclease [Tenacibaculum sp. MAR_2009_124]|uniref:HNH/ENDO VII family nuclease n=1 Tax=Tenacibaculum sp. MAR_2009_124 TaxID=1250059 RepID=UPI0029372E86|nr:HNH/ENDO VII family nuclease [Tenacibaculum sp. MAR_2009_124]